MPDQSSAAQEHALIQEIREPLTGLPDESLPAADAEFPTVLRGYDKFAVDAYVERAQELIAELQARRSPQAAVRRALERVGADVSGILQRAHDTAEGITAQSRSEAEDRLEVARRESAQMTSWARTKVKELDADTDRIWAERERIVGDARELARQLMELADAAAARFPAAEESPAAGETGATVAISPAQDDSGETQAFDPIAEGGELWCAPGLGEPGPREGESIRVRRGDTAPDAPTTRFEPFDAEADEPGGLPGELRSWPPDE